MGFYHSTTVLYGGRLVTDTPSKTKWQVLEMAPAVAILDRFGVKAELAGAADREEIYLYTDHHDLEIGDVFTTASVHGNKTAHWYDRITACADALGMEVEEPGWVTVHEYR